MITARRESNGFYDSVNKEHGGVAVLEKEEVSFASERVSNQTESIDDVRERMKRNLAMILNYDKPTKTVEEPVDVEKTAEKDTVEPTVAESRDDDIRPTTTTMQFGDGDVNQMFNELKKSESEKPAMSGKTKFALVLYAVAVTIILALIIINTGVLSLINNRSELKAAELNGIMNEYRVVREELAAHGDEYVENVAVNELGMIK